MNQVTPPNFTHWTLKRDGTTLIDKLHNKHETAALNGYTQRSILSTGNKDERTEQLSSEWTQMRISFRLPHSPPLPPSTPPPPQKKY